MPTTKILPLLIGADMNCYSMARAFHEAYGVKSYAFGRWAMGDTMYSRIVECTYIKDIDHAQVLLDTITAFAQRHRDKTCFVLGCTDDYASLLMELSAALPANCIAPYISPQLRDRLVNKADFYRLCDEYGLAYPKTYCVKKPLGAQQLTEQVLGFGYPVIVKPSSSILYWKHPFDGMKKVYVADTPQQAAQLLARIYSAGYPGEMVLQDFIPGDDSRMRVLTAYCDAGGTVRRMCMGHVGLEEHTPKALGNHAAIITEYHEPLMQSLRTFLQSIGYIGFANFDIRYDERDGSYRVLEMNLRQGRSNFYVTGAGWNLAELLVRDRLLGEDLGECQMYRGEHFWHSVPRAVVYRYVRDAAFVHKARALCAQGKESCTLHYWPDLRWNPRRALYYLVHMQRYFKKFKLHNSL